MRNLKKFLALVMAMVMAFSLMLTVNAKDIVTEFSDRDQADPAFAEAVDVLSGMKVFQGDPEGTFRPASTITRAEVAALIYRLATGDVDDVRAGLYANYGNFADVAENDWFAGYVGYCANAGYIKGHGGYFNPYGQVTGYEVLAMVLRAAGYDKNHEFEGATWQTNVSALATQLQVLTDVKTTHYGNTLHLASRRDVVASLLFNTAYKVHMVEYTPIGGYNQYNNLLGEKLNPTLGKKYFGLAYTTRIILGNQATGEGGTLLGNDTVEYTGTDGQEHPLDVSYVYPGSQIANANVTPNIKVGDTVTVGDGIKLAVKTGLDMFGHKVKAWYNEDDTATWKQTYATLDKSTLTATVQSTGGTQFLSTNDKALGVAAQKAGFTVDLDNSKAWISDRYSRISGWEAGSVAAAGTKRSEYGYGTPNGIFALISNNDGKTVDVIISLQGEVGLIAQKDTTATVQTLTVGRSGVNARGEVDKKSSFTGTDTGIFAVNSLTEASTQTLGDKVIAWQVVGTNKAGNVEYDYSAWAANTGNAGTHSNGNTNNFRYELEKLETTVSGNIQSINPTTGDLTMSDGTVYKPSWFRKLPTATQAGDKVIGADNTEECFTIPTTFQAGVTYTIALDRFGNWLGLTTAKNDFIYGTFADYEFGGLGTGSMKYAIAGVNWDGEKIINSEFKSLKIAADTYPSTAGDLGKGYSLDDFTVTKKFLGDNDTSGQGNQIKGGSHTGYVLDNNGLLDNNVPGSYGRRLTTDWTIQASDVSNGFADLAEDGTYLATPNTKFIVVSGTGSDTLDVKIYNGISEFLNGSSWVTIDGEVTATNVGKPGYAKSNTYFITEADRFNKWDTTANKQIASVIMDLRDVKWSNKTDVYYAAPGANVTDTGVQLAGTTAADNIKQFELYKNGVKGYYFIKTDVGSAYSPTAGVAAPTGNVTNGDFYTMIQIDTINGTPIYKAVPEAVRTAPATDQVRMDTRANGGNCLRGQYYNYIGVSNLSTAQIGSEVFDVSNAKVADVEWTPGCGRSEITSVLELNNAVSGGYTRTEVAIVFDGVNVSTIYVHTVA